MGNQITEHLKLKIFFDMTFYHPAAGLLIIPEIYRRHDSPKTECQTADLLEIWPDANIFMVLSSLSGLQLDCTLTQKCILIISVCPLSSAQRGLPALSFTELWISDSNYKHHIKWRLHHEDKEGAPWRSTFRALTLPPHLIIIPEQSKAQ